MNRNPVRTVRNQANKFIAFFAGKGGKLFTTATFNLDLAID